jgi:hypothetical protein
MDQIASQRIHERVNARIKSDSVINTRVVNQNVDASESLQRLLNGIPAGIDIGQVALYEKAITALSGIFAFQSPAFGFTAVHVGNSSSLGDQTSDDPEPNAFGTARDKGYFSVQSKLHSFSSITIRSRGQRQFCDSDEAESCPQVVQGVVADFGRSSLSSLRRRTSQLAATCVHGNHSSRLISWHLSHTRFALRQYGNPFPQKGPTLTINRDYTGGRGFWRDLNRSGTENSRFVIVLVIDAIFRFSAESECDFEVEHVASGVTPVCFEKGNS